MERNEKILLFSGIGLLAFILLSKARALGNLVFTPGTVQSMAFVGSTPVAQVSINAQNTSSASITINAFAGNVYSNNTLVGNIASFTPVLIPGNSITPVTVGIQFMLMGVANDIVNAFSSNNFSQDIKITGYANVSGLQLPVNLDFSFGNSTNL